MHVLAATDHDMGDVRDGLLVACPMQQDEAVSGKFMGHRGLSGGAS